VSLREGELILGRYRIESVLGRGGMGEVYRARHDRLGMAVAVKILTEVNDDMVRRFEREATLMARVRHPNVVAIADFGQTAAGLPCIVMEFIKGEDLGARMKRRGALPWRESLFVIRGILSGLDALHAAQVLHRDLKPDNVVIAPGEPEVVKLIDFGIAKPTGGGNGTRLTSTGSVVGTPAYMAPEQLLGYDLDVRSDIYTAGMILFELLTGTLPGEGHDMAGVLRRLKTDPVPPQAPADHPEVPQLLSDIVVAMLQGAPDRRPATVRELMARLADVEASSVTAAQGPASALGPTAQSEALPAAAIAAGPGTQGGSAGWGQPEGSQPPWPSQPSGYAPVPQGWPQGYPPPQQSWGGQQSMPPQGWPQGYPPPQQSWGGQQSMPPQGWPQGYPPPQPGWGGQQSMPPQGWPQGYSTQQPSWPAQPLPGYGAPPGYGPPSQATPIQSVQVAAHAQPMMRFVVVARLPPSRLALADERRWLSGFMGSLGRGFSLGAGIWFGIQSTPTPSSDAQAAADGLVMRLAERYGGTVRLACRLVDGSFTLSPAQLTGSQPLPQELADLLQSVSAG
jgi:serine/threonine-protein kinase